jgi:quinol monooxygenase YgiN
MTGRDETVVVIARWETTVDALSEVIAHIAALQPQALAEPGCLGYDVLQSVDQPNSLILIESYRDTAALDAHRNSVHYRELVIGRILPLLSDRAVVINHRVNLV